MVEDRTTASIAQLLNSLSAIEIFQRVQSHVNIFGSEIADGLACEGSHKNSTLDGCLAFSEIATRVKQDVGSSWKQADLCTAALFLSSKMNENRFKLEYVIKANHALLYRRARRLDVRSEAYYEKMMRIVLHEEALLSALGDESSHCCGVEVRRVECWRTGVLVTWQQFEETLIVANSPRVALSATLIRTRSLQISLVAKKCLGRYVFVPRHFRKLENWVISWGLLMPSMEKHVGTKHKTIKAFRSDTNKTW
ncbi:hypothetical protein TNCV_4491301 [Trichonephila clavipes]|nr:hypothetical protein TNCV_4491301 [Trichonephila clavipes]